MWDIKFQITTGINHRAVFHLNYVGYKVYTHMGKRATFDGFHLNYVGYKGRYTNQTG